MDLSKVEDLEFDGINYKDYPDFSDAYVCNAYYDGVEMTDDQLEELNTHHRDFVYEELWEQIF